MSEYTRQKRRALTRAVASDEYLTPDEFDAVLAVTWTVATGTWLPTELPHWADLNNPDTEPEEKLSLALDYYGVDR